MRVIDHSGNVVYQDSAATLWDTLANAIHRGIHFPNVPFDGCNLSALDFSGVNLRGSTFKGSFLRGTNLRDADLRDTDFTNADLRYAALHGAKTDCMIITGANLDGAKVDWQPTPTLSLTITGVTIIKCEGPDLVRLHTDEPSPVPGLTPCPLTLDFHVAYDKGMDYVVNTLGVDPKLVRVVER